MKAALTVLLFLLFGLGGAYWYQITAAQCPVPLHYKIGTIDDSFLLSPTEAKAQVEEAALFWESAVDRDLFVYDENADVVVDFVFDERQQNADLEVHLRNQLDTKKMENQKVLDTIASLQTSHEKLHTGYQLDVTEYERRLREYNQRVQKYNDQGGAPSDVYEELESERVALNKTAEKLSETAAQLNELAIEINELGDRGNQMVNEYNSEVDAYNTKYGFAREFTQGDYQQGVINVYKFSSTNELVTVLAHELGHALGIGHVESTSSVMYYLLEDLDVRPVLSGDDVAAYYEICGTGESLGQKIHRNIRDFIRKTV